MREIHRWPLGSPLNGSVIQCNCHDYVIKWKHFPHYWPLYSPVTGEFPSQRPVTRSFDIDFLIKHPKLYNSLELRLTVRKSKINALARTQLTFQMLTLQTQIFILPDPVFQYMGQQMSGPASSNGRTFGMNPKVQVCPALRHFLPQKLRNSHKEHPFVSRKWMLLPAQTWHLRKYIYSTKARILEDGKTINWPWQLKWLGIRHDSEGWVFKSPIFCRKYFLKYIRS